jgi:N-methylhydantoinase A/oxoprolinase/acetone carboxylase beta subunit
MMRIGIDVGGTNTDAVLIEGASVLGTAKTTTTADITSGITAALNLLLANGGIAPTRVDAVMIGTTHFTNAVIERRGLTKVAAIRVSLPAAAQVKPFADWPKDLRALVEGDSFMVRGGHEVDGRPIAPLDRAALAETAKKIRQSGVRSVAITACFSPLTSEAEMEAARIVQSEMPEVAVTCSHDLGRIGLLARENVTLLNASLIPLARATVASFVAALREAAVEAPLYLTQNDGTIARASAAEAFPVLCFASGPTNSLRGAAFLSVHRDALVIDVGGTTSDVGALQHGFPREANNVIHVGGVRTLFRMPDLLSIGLGGGTIINPADPTDIGPRSVGYRLRREARVFGGDTVTCTDIGVAAGLIDLGDRARLAGLSDRFVEAALAHIHAIIAAAIDRMQASTEPMPLIAVGGGAFLVPRSIPGISEVISVPHQSVANAIGAAIAQVSGEVDKMFQNVSRGEAIRRAEALASERACRVGADPATIHVVDVEDLPLSYMPGNTLRVHLRVVGDIAGGRS